MRRAITFGILGTLLAFTGAGPGSPGDEPRDTRPGQGTAADTPASEAAPALKPVLVLDTGGHTGVIRRVLITPDGKQVLSVSVDKTVRIWDAATGQLVRVLRPPIGKGPAGELRAGALSPDGAILAVAGWGVLDGTQRRSDIYLIGLADGKVRLLRGHGLAIDIVAFSPDGKLLASGGFENSVRVWDVAAGTCPQELKGHESTVTALAFSPDSTRLASGSWDQTVRLWTVKTGTQDAVLKGHPHTVMAVAWRRDGKAVYSGGFNDPHVHVWDVASGKDSPINAGIKNGGILDLAVADDRDVLFTWRWRRQRQHFTFGVSHLDPVTGEHRRGWLQQEGSSGTLLSTALSPDGRWAATSAGEDLHTYLWKTADGSVVQRLGGPGQPVFSVGWSADGAAIAWGVPRFNGDHKPPLKTALDLRELTLRTKFDRDAFRGRQKTLGGLTVSEASNSRLLIKEGDKLLTPLDLQLIYRSYTLLGGDRLAVGVKRTVQIFEARTGQLLLHLDPHGGPVPCLAPSPDGRYLLAGSEDQTVSVYVPDRAAPLLSVFAVGADWIAWTPEGYYAASPGGEKLMGWHVNHGLDALGSFHPASHFRASLYRPDVIRRLLTEGSLEKALAAADQARGGTRSAATEVADVLPPEVTLQAPGLKGAKVSEPALKLVARAQGKGKHPVTAMQLLLDGRPYEGSGGLRKVTAEPGQAQEEEWTVQLTPGSHTLRVLARSAASMGLSNDLEVTYDAPVPRPSLFVLAIGINQYQARDLQPLRFAVNDAAGLEQTFQERSRPLFDRIQARVLPEAEATRDGVLRGLKWLQEADMKANDLAVVFYAGHGGKDEKGNFYLMPRDADKGRLAETAVSADELKRHLAALRGRVLLLLDACHSGAIGPVINDLARDLADEDTGVVVMCASLGSEEAGEADGHGYFCKALIDGLAGKAAKNPRDGCVYLHHLEQYVIDTVQQLSEDRQHPTTAKPAIRPLPLSQP
jgi:WD40 repeat protein